MTTYRTIVLYVQPSPLGLVGDRWIINHWCNTCHHNVPADQLIAHTKTHTDRRARQPGAGGEGCHESS